MNLLPLAYLATEVAAKTPKVPHKDFDIEKLMPVIIAVCVTVVVSIIVGIKGKKAKQALKGIGARLGLGYEAPPMGKIWPFSVIRQAPLLNGILAGRQVVIRHILKGKKTYTTIDMALAQRGSLELRITRHSVFNTYFSKSIKKFTTGDRFVDYDLMMYSNQPDIASAVVGAPSIAGQLSAFVQKHELPGILTLKSGLLRYEERGLIAPGKKAARIEALVPICLSLAAGVETAGEIAMQK